MAYDDHVEEVFQAEIQRQDSDHAATRTLWDLVKNHLGKYTLLEVAEKFPQFAKEASFLAVEVTRREDREKSTEDDMRAIGNDRL